ncbi:hypothetical protein TNIN_194751 [Trichonephila inaurata madagascariensis]|uniref:Endonuclease/exonuclease/phosphatase domain-containing protein n=1 Tax=Trichonephila inaurata madagascariensis TaxID=2747483 RepID=A0A8X6YS07_9ARAC|nr:hypothetical protein TNIN_194751 [Trichonephila inaurata madagascariensis]
MNPTCRNLCLNMKFLRANWNVCKVQDFIAINRCFKCLGYHHKAADCQNGLCCFKCAGEHKNWSPVYLDTNSKSETWFSPLSDSRGTKLAEFISAHNLFVVNEDCGPTFCGSRGSSYIDVTAVGTDLLEDVSCWHLPAYDSLSDHKAIEFDIALNSNSPSNDGDSCMLQSEKA